MSLLHDSAGEPISVGGYAVTWATPSAPLAELGGRSEVFVGAPAFDSIMAQYSAGSMPLTVNVLQHDNSYPFCSTATARIRLWCDVVGLGFEVTDIKASGDRAHWCGQVFNGTLRQVSIFGSWSHRRTPRADGSLAVEHVQTLDHLTLTRPGEAAYSGTLVMVAGQYSTGTGPVYETAKAWERARTSPLSYAPPLATPRPTINAAAKPTTTAPQTITRITQDKQGRYHREVVPAARGARR